MYWLLAIVYFSLTVHAYDYGHNYQNNYIKNSGFNDQKNFRSNLGLSFDAQATFNPCQQGSGVFYHPNPTNVHEFYHCDDFGVAHLQSCGDLLVWDDLHTTCNWPDAVGGQSSSGTLSSSTTTTTTTTTTEAPAPKETEGLVPTETEGSAPTEIEGSAPTETEGSAPTETEGLAPTETEGLAPTETEGLAPTETEASATKETEIEELATEETEESGTAETEPSSTNKTSSSSSLCDKNNPCGKHGQCVELLSTASSSPKRVACVCDENWFGRLCDKRIDDLTTPALTHDEFLDDFQPSPSTTTTILPSTTTTVSSISLCAQITPCGEHGQCIDLITADTSSGLQFSCICDKDWSGPLCDKHISDSKETVSHVHVDEDKTKLTTGTTVSLCAQLTPCGEHGQCMDSVTTDASSGLQFSCICDKGWSGPLCEKYIGVLKEVVLNVHGAKDKKKLITDTTVSICDKYNPCGEHGKCVDSSTAKDFSGLQFSCICDKDWSGLLCENHIGESKEAVLDVHADGDKKKFTTGPIFSSKSLCDERNPCGEHGKCVETHLTSLSGEPHIACVCDENWFGRLCDKHMDDLTTPVLTPVLTHDLVQNTTKTRETFSLPVYTKEDAKYIFYGLKGDNKLKLSESMKKRMMDPKEQKDDREKMPSKSQIPSKRTLIRIAKGDMK